MAVRAFKIGDIVASGDNANIVYLITDIVTEDGKCSSMNILHEISRDRKPQNIAVRDEYMYDKEYYVLVPRKRK